jgi:hypothetical protein
VTDRSTDEEPSAAPEVRAPGDPGVPPFLRTYALAYAIGAVWLAAEVLLLGTQAKYAFTGAYDALLVLPPVLTAVCLLLVDRRGRARTLPLRALALSLVAGVTSVISTVVLTPVLVLMFREGVGRSLSATGTVSAISLVVVASPLVIELAAAARSRRWLHAGVLVAGLATAGVALSMALDPTGPLAVSMRLDQGELLMITSSWWLPVYALAAAYARRLGMA